MGSTAEHEKLVTAVATPMLDRIGPRSPGMGNPPCYLWEIATPEGVAIVLANIAIKALRSLPVEQRMELMGMERVGMPFDDYGTAIPPTKWRERRG